MHYLLPPGEAENMIDSVSLWRKPSSPVTKHRSKKSQFDLSAAFLQLCRNNLMQKYFTEIFYRNILLKKYFTEIFYYRNVLEKYFTTEIFYRNILLQK